MPSATIVRRIVLGARTGSALERASFGALTSFATTIGTSRSVNYVRERQRRFPRLRSFGRRAARTPRTGGVRVHHFLPGIGIAFAVGGTAIATHSRAFWLSLPYGSGVALTLDELALLLKQDNAYWRSERLALFQGAAAGGAAALLAARFHRRGVAAVSR